MHARLKARWPWMLLLPGALIAGCSDNPTPVRPIDVGTDLSIDSSGDDVTDDTAEDVKAQDNGGDDVAPKDAAEDSDDASDDVTSDDVVTDDVITDDVSADATTDDVVTKDASTDATTVDAGPDAPPPVDVGPDAPPPVDVGPDAPPPVDVPADVRPDVAPDAPPTGCTLTTQRALTLPTDRVMATVSGMSRINMACVAVGGPEHIYPLRIATRTGIQLSTEGSAFDTVLMLRRACNNSMTELGCNDDVPGSTVSYVRRVVDPGDYFVVVDTYGTGMGGMYTLNLSTYTPAANAECGGATALTATTAITGNTSGGGASATSCLTDQWGPQLYYTLSIPAGQRATITATPTGTPAWRAVVRAQPSCATNSCLANGTSPMAGMPAVETVDNRGTAPLNVVVTVASTSGTTGGAFSLRAAFSPTTMAPANAACSMARVVADGATITAENPGLGTTRLNGVCVGGAQGTSLFYRATVPPRSTLVFTTTPTGMWDPVIRFLNACAATTCAASIDAGDNGTAETLRWTNTGTTSQDIYVAVSSYDASNSGAFNGTVRILPPPANVTCAMATAVTPGVTLAAQNAALGASNLTGPCLPTATGTVLYYSVRVPAGEQLTARARPVAGVDPVLRLLDGCSATMCLASANAGAAGANETLVFNNTTRTDRTLILAVGGATNASNGFFDLDVTVRREYTESTTPRACDDMTGGATVMGVGGDDTVSGLIDLPFPFTFYSERELEFSVSSNGLIQLWPSLMGTPTASFDNVAIPTSATPNNFIAALWDDLLPVMGSSVLTRTLGAAPNRRFVIQWTSFAIFGDDRARLTFQTKLFESTNVIELHYCALTAGTGATRVTGSEATVGIESPTGAAGVQHSLNTAMSVGTTNAIRFTP